MSFEGTPATIVNHGPDAEPKSSELGTQLEQYKGNPLADKMLKEFNASELEELNSKIFDAHTVGYGILGFDEGEDMTDALAETLVKKMRDLLNGTGSAKEIAATLNKI